ncbi:MAG: Cell surface protein [Ignavibacteriae bacterium]|nr:MAG: Cell surface protein [Ignavibacteriota bacterium]
MKTSCIILIMFMVGSFILSGYCQQTKVTWYSLNMGFAEAKASNTIVKSIAGQNFVGSLRYGDNVIESGFLVDTLFRSLLVGVQEELQMPSVFELHQNYPNPFNPNTTIRFEIPKTTHVTLKIYNVLGQEVAELVNEEMKPGTYNINWNPLNIASGIYLYRLKADDFLKTNKMILLR